MEKYEFENRDLSKSRKIWQPETIKLPMQGQNQQNWNPVVHQKDKVIDSDLKAGKSISGFAEI